MAYITRLLEGLSGFGRGLLGESSCLKLFFYVILAFVVGGFLFVGGIRYHGIVQKLTAVERETERLRVAIDKQFVEISHLKQVVGRVDQNLLSASLSPVPTEKRINTGTPPVVDRYEQLIDRNVVRIGSTAFRRVSGGRLRLIMEMYNVNPPSTLEGRVIFSLRTSDGKILPLTHDDTKFKIIRFRKLAVFARLPISNVDTAGMEVVVEVIVNNTIVYRRFYPLLK